MEHARISYTFLARDKRKRDWDNLLTACKPWQDSLIDAGIIQFDDTDHLEIGSMKFSRGKVVQTIITVEEVM